MRLVNRAAITVKPKRPYIDWANTLDDDGPKITQEHLPERAVYLVDDIEDFPGNMSEIVERHFAEIFEQELVAWHRIESDWPENRDFATFVEWFEVEVHSMILDLSRRRFATEPFDGY